MTPLDKKIIGQSPAAIQLKKMIALIAPSDAPAIIFGATGSGKELVAEALHEESRRKGRFVTINCAAIPKELIEAEIFGFEKGAFTGAVKSSIGKFEQAQKGTLFLDEIGDMPADLQTKLLRVLEKIFMNISGSIYPPRRNKLENILSWIMKDNNIAAKTLTGVVVRKRKTEFIFYREPEECYKSVNIRPLTSRYSCWDGRFFLKANKSNNLQIRALGDVGITILKEERILKRQGFQNVPLSAWKTVPGVWSKKRLISVPTLGYCKQKDLKIYIKSNNII